MAAQTNFPTRFTSSSFSKPAFIGAAIGLVLMIVFFYGDNVLDNRAWDFGFRNYFPMIAISVGGALGGALFGVLAPLRKQGGWPGVLATIACALAFGLALWLSAVAGFAVTGDWD